MCGCIKTADAARGRRGSMGDLSGCAARSLVSWWNVEADAESFWKFGVSGKFERVEVLWVKELNLIVIK